MSDVIIRDEMPADHERVHEVNRLAFGRPGEAVLVDTVRGAAPAGLSLVALVTGEIAGHILFTPVRVESRHGQHWTALALGPMAVVPRCQRRGIGSALVHTGLEVCRKRGHDVVFVLGHPDFYPRFGFTPAHACGIVCEFAVPREAFMVVELAPGALAGREGIVRYLPAFARL